MTNEIKKIMTEQKEKKTAAFFYNFFVICIDTK